MEKFGELKKAVEKAKQIKGIVVSYSIQKNLDGKYEVDIDIYEAYDGLTRYVFVDSEDGNRLRDVVVENENTYYEDTENINFEMKFECNSFNEAEQKLKEILEKISNDRKKIRQSCREDSGYIVF